MQMNLLSTTRHLCSLSAPKQLMAAPSAFLQKNTCQWLLSAQCLHCLPFPSTLPPKKHLCAKEFCATSLHAVIGPLFFFLFRADPALAFLGADPPTTSAADPIGLLSLLVRDNSASPACPWAPSKLCLVIPRRGPRFVLGTEPTHCSAQLMQDLRMALNCCPQQDTLSPWSTHP